MRHTGIKLAIIILVALFSAYVSLPSKIPVNIPQLGINQTFQKNFLSMDLSLGLDLVGGTRLTFEADTSSISDDKKAEAIESVIEVVRRRVNLFGVSEASVTSSNFSGTNRIIVELPGISDPNEAKSLVGRTAQLTFAEVSESNQLLPSNLTGADLVSARLGYETVGGRPIVSIEFSEEGAKKFEELTGRNIGKPLPIILDTEVLSAPLVNERIVGGKAQISGEFDSEAARSLAVQLTAGALPIPINLVEERTVGATLGNQAVETSVKAGLVGVILVCLFMVVIYRKMGLIACTALFIFGVISLAIYKLVPITLTVPGIAGFLLSVGMAVDSNILTFERYREEVKKGMPSKAALEIAFGKAWDAIRDANVATLIAAFILANPLDWEFLNVSGPVRGFAYTLAIGIFVSLFTGLFVSRTLLRVFVKK